MKPKAIFICGLPGTGKTYIAWHLARELKATHINSDRVRQARGLTGQYDHATKARVYELMKAQLRETLSAGDTAIVAATFYKKDLRDAFAAIARACEAERCWVRLTASDATIKERVARTRPDSEADFEVYLKLKAAFEPFAFPHLMLATDDRQAPELIKTIKRHCHIEE